MNRLDINGNYIPVNENSDSELSDYGLRLLFGYSSDGSETSTEISSQNGNIQILADAFRMFMRGNRGPVRGPDYRDPEAESDDENVILDHVLQNGVLGNRLAVHHALDNVAMENGHNREEFDGILEENNHRIYENGLHDDDIELGVLHDDEGYIGEDEGPMENGIYSDSDDD